MNAIRQIRFPGSFRLLFVALSTVMTQSVFAATYADAILADGPIAYWRFNDVGPFAVNAGSLGAAANGTYNGNAAPGAQAPRSPTFAGFEATNTAVQLDGNGDFVSTAASLMNSRPSFTISGWVRRNTDQLNRTGLWGQNDLVEFGFITNSTLQFWSDFPALDVVSPILNGQWAHLAIVSNGSPGTREMYINGGLVGTNAHILPADNLFSFNIGGAAFDATGNFFNGQIDEVAIFGRALSGSAIRAQYDAAFQAPSGVPDTGSGLTMLAVALLLIYQIRRRIKI